MKERAAIQCMEKMQQDSDTEGKDQFICAYEIGEEGSLCHQTQKHWRETLPLVSRY